jgi:hypothetical protein
MLMDEGIPDLVRRFIRDEIMKKETSHVEIISSGLYAIGEALNLIYRQRLESKGNEMLNTDDRYHRAHCVYGDCNYYEFTPQEKSIIGPTLPKDSITFHGLPESKPSNLESLVGKITVWNHTHESKIVSNWPWIRDTENKSYKLDSDIPDGYFLVKKDNPWSILNTSSEAKDIGELLPTMAWLQIHGWPATYCNFFAQDLSYNIFGHLPWEAGKVANDIHKYILENNNFLEILSNDVHNYVQLGYVCYFTQLGKLRTNSQRWPGHISTSWIERDQIIQAGSSTGIYDPDDIFESDKVKIHMYLGFLKRRNK